MLPTSLNALAMFEAAARHQSYSLAAAELHITHSAVSQQMRILERTLAVALFERQGRQMVLTDRGSLLLKQVQPALRQLQRAMAELAAEQAAPTVNVSTLPSFASFWLVPRLSKFQQRFPEVTVHLKASLEVKNLRRHGTDIAIRYGLGTWDDGEAERILDDQLFPVCSPNFNGGKLPTLLRNLKRYRLLGDHDTREWNAWGQCAGLDASLFRHKTQFGDSILMLAAAIAGQGVAIGRSSLVAGDLKAGRLVRLFDVVAPSDFAYYMVTPRGASKTVAVQAFEQWLRRETAQFEKKLRL